MVTVPEYQAQLQARRTTLEQARGSTEGQVQQQFTQQQLRDSSRIQRQQAVSTFEQAKGKALGEIEEEFEKQEELEEEFEPAQQQFQEQQVALEKQQQAQRLFQEEQAEWKTAQGIVDKKVPAIGLVSKSLEKKIRAIQSQEQSYKERREGIAEFKEGVAKWEKETGGKIELEGLKPVAIDYPGFETMTPEEFSVEVTKLQAEQVEAPLNLARVPKPPIDTSNWWEKAKEHFPGIVSKNTLTPFVYKGIDVRGVFNFMSKVPAPQELAASKLSVEQLQKIPVIKDIAAFETEMIKSGRKTIPTILSGVTEDFKGGTKAFSELVEFGIKQQPAIKFISSLPSKQQAQILRGMKGTEQAIGGGIVKGVKAVGTGIKEGAGIVYYASGARAGFEAAKEFMQTTPAPQEWKWVQEIGEPSLFGIKEPFKALELQYLEEIKPITFKAPEGKVYIQDGKEVSQITIPGREPGRVKWFQEKLTKGYQEAGTGLGESYLQLKKGKLVSPWIGKQQPDYKFSLGSKVIGGAAGIVGGTQFYFLPGTSTPMLIGSHLEAAGRGELGDYIRKHKLETALVATIIGAKIAKPIVKYAREPVVKWITKPKVTVSSISKSSAKGLGTKGEFLLTVKRGKAVKSIQPRYQTWLNIKPRPEQLLKAKAQTYQFLTPGKFAKGKITGFAFKKKPIVTLGGKIVGERPVLMVRKGAKQFTVIGVSGKGKVITAKDLTSLTKANRKLLEQTAKSQGWQGQSELSLKKFLSKKEVSLQSIRGRKIMKIGKVGGKGELGSFDLSIKKGKGIVDFKPLGAREKKAFGSFNIKEIKPGRTITRKESISIMDWQKKKVSWGIGAESGQYKGQGFFKGKTGARDVTFPFRKGKPVIIKETAEVTGRIGIEPFYKDPFLRTSEPAFKSKFNLMEQAFDKGSRLPRGTILKTEATITDTLLGGTQAELLKFVPKVSIATPVLKIGTDLITPTLTSVTALSIIPEVKVETKLIERTILKPIIKPALKPILKPTLKIGTKLETKIETKITTKPILKPITKPIIKPILKPILKTTQTVPDKGTPTPIPKIPKVPWIPLVLEPELKKKKKKRELKKKGLFVPYGRRYGKFIPISRPTTLRKAKRKGVGFLRKTLGATIELRKAKTGERVRVGKIGRGFRLGKKGKDPFQLVQRRGFRLGSRAERIALVRARSVKFI